MLQAGETGIEEEKELDIPVQSGPVEVHRRFGIMYYRLFLAGFLLGLFFSPQDGEGRSFRNVRELLD
jgi:hypothetical protein